MDLKSLRNDVLNTCDRVLQDGHDLEDIKVSMQIDGEDQSFFQSSEPSVNYDDNGNVSGCVILGYKDAQKNLNNVAKNSTTHNNDMPKLPEFDEAFKKLVVYRNKERSRYTRGVNKEDLQYFYDIIAGKIGMS